jgi:hypothetical protein
VEAHSQINYSLKSNYEFMRTGASETTKLSNALLVVRLINDMSKVSSNRRHHSDENMGSMVF